jgi:hypothetical protein
VFFFLLFKRLPGMLIVSDKLTQQLTVADKTDLNHIQGIVWRPTANAVCYKKNTIEEQLVFPGMTQPEGSSQQ